MKQFKLCLLFLFISSFAFSQTTPWSSTPTVTTQSRLFGGVFQVRDINSAHVFSWPDTLAKLIGKADSNIYKKDGTLTDPRTVLLNQKYLWFKGTSGAEIKISDGLTTGAVTMYGIGTSYIGSIYNGTDRLEFTTDNISTGQRQAIYLDPSTTAPMSTTPILIQDDGGHTPEMINPLADPLDSAGLVTKRWVDSAIIAGNFNIGNHDLTIVGGTRTLSTGTNTFIISDGGITGLAIVPGTLTQFSGGTGTTYGQIGASATGSAISYYNPAFGSTPAALSFSSSAITLTDPLSKGIDGAAYYGANYDSLSYTQFQFNERRYLDKTIGGTVNGTIRIGTTGSDLHGLYMPAHSDYAYIYFNSQSDVDTSSNMILQVGDNETGEGAYEGWIFRKNGSGDLPTPTPNLTVAQLNQKIFTWMGDQVMTMRTTYSRTHTDSVVAQATTFPLLFSPTSGTTVTNTSLIGANILGVWRGGMMYTPTSGTPTDSQYAINILTGTITFSTAFYSGESVQVQANNSTFTMNGIPTPRKIYSNAASITYPITQPALIEVLADENKGGAKYFYYADAGCSSYTQLQAIATTPNTF